MKPKKVRNTVNNKANIAPPVTQHIRAEEERDQLITEMAGNLQRISALHSVVAAASQSLDLDAVLQEVIKKISEIFHFDATRIFLFNTQMDELHLQASLPLTYSP